MVNVKVTRTYGPIHFEDLDPHRFEDLVRELIYDYRDWQNIEATGRSGNDGGFDIRAFERKFSIGTSEREESEEFSEERVLVEEGNLWMIQCKREKVIGPAKIREILEDVNARNLPYGYILSAATNFSKDSYDLFRKELQEKGVMEFHLWGKAELEDMLHQPKNDRILFAFFGISLVSKRRSRSTEVRTSVINKNKILRIFGEQLEGRPLLIRDINDTKYPYESEYQDFKFKPRWREYPAKHYFPLGIVVGRDKYFAYVDHIKKEYDFAETASLIYRNDDDDDRREQRDASQRVEDFWAHLPKANQAYYLRDGLLRFDEMLIIDEKGDSLNKFPHIFVDVQAKGPFARTFEYVETLRSQKELNGYKRIKIFPEKFPEPRRGKLHRDKELHFKEFFLYRIQHGSKDFHTIYETDGRFSFLKVRDAYPVANPNDSSTKNYIAITRIESTEVKDYLARNPEAKASIQEQLERDPRPKETINVYEFRQTYDFWYEKKREQTSRDLPSSL
jgi:hypothetical protein